MSPGLRLGWLLIESLLAFVGLALALNTSPDGHPVVSAVATAVYLPVVVLLCLVTYLLHRRAPRTPPGAAAPRAVIDTLLAAAVGAPILLVVLAVVSSVRDCTTGFGC